MPMTYTADDFLTLTQVSKAICLDRRTIKKVATKMGGKKIGSCWRFKWSAVSEYFHANFDAEQERSMDGEGSHQRQANCLQNVPIREARRSRVASCKKMGGRTTKSSFGETSDPNGLGLAYELGQ